MSQSVRKILKSQNRVFEKSIKLFNRTMHLNYRYLYVLILTFVICNKDLTCHALKFEARNEANIEFEPGRLSYCLLNERHNKERWVDCLYSKEPVIEMPTSFLHDFDLCLRKIEYKSLLDSHMSDEQIVISYHGCLASAELQQMASKKILQADYNSVTLGKKGLKYPLLINSICFIIVLTVILYLVGTVDWKLWKGIGNSVDAVRNTASVEAQRLRSGAVKVKSVMQTLLRKFQKEEKSGSGLDRPENFEDLPMISYLHDSGTANCGEERSPIDTTSSSDSESVGDYSVCMAGRISAKELSIGLTSKGKDRVFDLTTKSGREEWKEYVNRGRGQPVVRRENVVDQNNDQAENAAECNNQENNENIELDPFLQNVPLYDRHGKPLRRLCLPGIGWVSRRKFLERKM